MSRITIEKRRLKDLSEFLRQSSRYSRTKLMDIPDKGAHVKNMVSFKAENGPYAGGAYYSIVGGGSSHIRAIAHMFEIFSPLYTGKGLGVEAMYEFEKFLIEEHNAEVLEGPSNSRTDVIDWLKRRGFRPRGNSIWKRLGLVETIDKAEFLGMLGQVPELFDERSAPYVNAPHAHTVKFTHRQEDVGIACYWLSPIEPTVPDMVADVQLLGIFPKHRKQGFGRSFLSSLERYVSDVHKPQPSWSRAQTETDSTWYADLGYRPLGRFFVKQIGPATLTLPSGASST